MSFSFFQPWMWLGVLAIAAPIWLHLRRKPETNLLRFSTLRFLQDQPHPKQAPIHLRNLLLLLLRVTAVLLVVAGFAWPYLRLPAAIPIKESRVYILDNTLSHQAEGGFDRDKKHLAADLERAEHDMQVAVVELTTAPRVVASFSDDRETARSKINALASSYERGSYLAAFRQANAVLANSLGGRKHVILLGDSQENQWTEGSGTPPFLKGVQVDLPKPGATELPNLALAEARVQRVFLGDKSLIHLTVRLSHSGEAKKANIAIRSNDQLIVNRTLELENQPASILLQAQWEADPNAAIRGQATVEGSPDALAADNTLYFALQPVTEGRVALLAQSSFLRLALSPEVMRGQWANRIIDPSKLAAELESSDEADALCLESSYLQSADARKLLQRYLSHGRGVLLLVNRVTPTIRGALRDIGFEAEVPGPGDAKFQFVFSNHPIFHPFLSSDYGNLMEISILKCVALRGPDAMPLVFGDKGSPLFFERRVGSAKLFVTAFGLDRDQTSWPIHQTFIPFLDLTLQACRAEDSTPTEFEPGQTAVLTSPAGSQTHEYILSDSSQELARVRLEQGKVKMPMPSKPGNYFLSTDNAKQEPKLISVNISPKESQLTFVRDPDALQGWRVQGSTAAEAAVAARTLAATVSRSSVLQQTFWWWMILGSALALGLEALVAQKPEKEAR